MTESSAPDTASLEALRREIDAADAQMHGLLIHRGRVIEQLIAAKRLGKRGAAFRPDREADMMRRIAARHDGGLPLSTVEHIWREIIGTFTQLQAPFAVHAAGVGDPVMRDLLRYYFGFSTPLVEAGSASGAIEAVRRSGADLAVVRLDAPLEERWWAGLSTAAASGGPSGVAVIACLPFLPLAPTLDFPRVLVVAPADVAAPADLFLYALAAAPDAVSGMTVVASGDAGVLVASPLPPAGFAGAAGLPARCIGSFAAPLDWPN